MARTGSRGQRPVGRRPGDPEETKRAILDAARTCFAESGFDRATIRAIAAAADVDPALVIHHFSSKQQLFAAAHELPFDPAELVASVLACPPDERGRCLARAQLTLLTQSASPALSLVRAASTNEGAATMLREFLTSALLVHAPELAPGPDGERRLALAGTHLIGIVLGRELIRLEPLATASVDELVDLVAPTIQRYLDGPEG